MSDASDSIEVRLPGSGGSQFGVTRRWHENVFPSSQYQQQRSSTRGLDPAQSLCDVSGPADVAPRARGASVALSPQQQQRLSTSARYSSFQDPNAMVFGDSSITFDILSGTTGDDDEGHMCRRPNESTIEFEFLSGDTHEPSKQASGSLTKKHHGRGPKNKSTSSGRRQVGDHLNRLYHVGLDRKLAKQQWACLERAKRTQLEEYDPQCTFHPQLSSLAKSIDRPRELSPEFRASSELQRRTEWRAVRQRDQLQKELEECTFKPLTLSAAKLHASALIQRSDIFETLYSDHKKRQQFREQMQMKAVEEMEKRVLHRREGASGSPLRDSAYVDTLASNMTPANGLREVLTREEVDEIVNRLLHRGIGNFVDDPAARGETFHPQINPTSQRLAEAARNRDPQKNETKAKRSTATQEYLRDDLVRDAKEKLAHERRKKHAELLFHLLAEQAIASQRARNAGGEREDISLPESAAAICELPLDSVCAAGVALRLPESLQQHVERAIAECKRQAFKRVGRSVFVQSLLSFTPFSSVDVTHHRRRSDSQVAPITDATDVVAPSKDKERVVPTHQEVVERLLRKQQSSTMRVSEERERLLQERAKAEMKECTFEPIIHAHKVKRAPSRKTVPESATILVERCVEQLDKDAHEHRQQSSRHRQCVVSGSVRELQHHTLTSDEPAAHTTVMATSRPSYPNGLDEKTMPTHAFAAAMRDVGPHGLYRDVISEHAALGPPRALQDLGARLMKEQLKAQRST